MSPGRTFRAAVALAAAAGTPALALAPETPLTAEQAIETQREGVREAVGAASCAREREGGEIVVCGRRGPDPHRLPLVDRVPGERENLLPGELPRAESSFGTCVVGCQPTGLRIDVIRTIQVAPKIVRHILGKDD